MVKKKQILFKSRERKDAKALAGFLRQLADKIEENQVTLQQGSDETPLVIPHNVMLGLKVKRNMKPRNTKYKFVITVNWLEGDTMGGVSLG